MKNRLRGVRRIGRAGDCAPYCTTCRSRMRLNGHSKNSQWFRCSKCIVSIFTPYDPSTHALLADDRPCCVSCRRAMAKRGKTELGVPVFTCLTCNTRAVSRTSRRVTKPKPVRQPKPVMPNDNPCCVTCREQMVSGGKLPSGVQNYRCRTCGTGVRAFYKRAWRDLWTSRRQPSEHIPYCVKCRVKMHRAYRTTAPARNDRFRCPKCKVNVSRHHSGILTRKGTYSNGDELLTFIGSQMPKNIPGEIRAEVTQAIACDLLLRKVRRQDLSRRKVRAYIKQSYGMSSNKFMFVSLEKPLPSGGRFGDLLEG